jgi:hypothetical protein
MADDNGTREKLKGDAEANGTYKAGKPRYKVTGFATRADRETPVMVPVEHNGRAPAARGAEGKRLRYKQPLAER